MKTLTREQAIKRIEDIKKRVGVDHLEELRKETFYLVELGAIKELMAIFDIKEEDLK